MNAFLIVLLAVLATAVTLLVFGIVDIAHAAHHGADAPATIQRRPVTTVTPHVDGKALSTQPVTHGAASPATLLSGPNAGTMAGCGTELPAAFLADLTAIHRQQYTCNEAAAWLANVRALDTKYPGLLQTDGQLTDAVAVTVSSTCAPVNALKDYRETCWSQLQTVFFSRLF